MYRGNSSLSKNVLLITLAINLAVTVSLILPSTNFAQNNLNLEPEEPPQRRQIAIRITAGTNLSVSYDLARKILVSPNEPGPIPLTLNLTKNLSSFNANSLI